MTIDKVLQMIDEHISRHIKTIDEHLAYYDAFSSLRSIDYLDGAVGGLEELRDEIKKKGSEE